MIELTQPLEKVIKSNNFDKLKPFAIMFRNKWDATENKFVLDTDNPIDISNMIVKPNTLSMTLDVSEIAQFKANNITLTLHDPFNKFLEGTPYTYFTSGYQLYGSQVILYYGLDNENKTSLFVGIIKELPTHKPEQYQLELKLISPLELLNDIEAKEFSDKYEGEALIADGFDDDNNPIYKTSHTGVGGFNAVYADSAKMFEGVDFQVADTNSLNLPAKITIINSDLHTATITADYYCWKTDLRVEQIISGLVALGGYTAEKGNTDIRSVIWKNAVRNPTEISNVFASLGYYENENAENDYTFNWVSAINNTWADSYLPRINEDITLMESIIPKNFDLSFRYQTDRKGIAREGEVFFAIGTKNNSSSYKINDGVFIEIKTRIERGVGIFPPVIVIHNMIISKIENGLKIDNILEKEISKEYPNYFDGIGVLNGLIRIEKRGTQATIYTQFQSEAEETSQTTFNDNYNFNMWYQNQSVKGDIATYEGAVLGKQWNFYDDNGNLIAENVSNPCILTEKLDKHNDIYPWGAVNATLTQAQEEIASSQVKAYFSTNGNIWSEPAIYDLGTELAQNYRYLRYMIYIASSPNIHFDIKEPNIYYYDASLYLQLVNLSNKTILETLQDFALISGYEFGVNRNGVFFFRPRSQSTTPIYDLGHNEIVKVETINKKFNDFFTKLTLQFAQVPLEFYANEGERPTPVDRYGIINKEINKPEIVNYDNPELAQAIGPQLLAIYSKLADIIQVSAKLNLSLELGDIINLKRNYNLTAEPSASDLSKFQKQDTYFQACKIVGLNYNFSKRQMTYTLRNVSNENNRPS